jgi:diguanylate cyclase
MIGTYNYWLVMVSLLVAMLASYTALDLATRITASRGKSARACPTSVASPSNVT